MSSTDKSTREGLFPAPRLIDGAGVDRIIARTRLECGDRNLLGEKLNESLTYWLVYPAIDAKKDPKLYDAIAQSAHKLKAAIQAAPANYTSGAIYISPRKVFLEQLDFLATAASAARRGQPRLNRSPKDWFVVDVLRPIFENIFGKLATITAKGPFVRFAEQVAKEMNAPGLASRTIRNALKDFRSGRSSREPPAIELKLPDGDQKRRK